MIGFGLYLGGLASVIAAAKITPIYKPGRWD
jgi:hypothetical protein